MIAGITSSNNCCEPSTKQPSTTEAGGFPDFIDSPNLYTDIAAVLNETYYYISEDLVAKAVKKGIGKDLEIRLREFLLTQRTICYCETNIKKYDEVIKKARWDSFYAAASTAEKFVLDELFKPRKALKISFSGEEDWIMPPIDPTLPSVVNISPALAGGEFLMTISITLDVSQPAITFYNKEKLKEDFNTTLPLVKIELDDKIKLEYTDKELVAITEKDEKDDLCCLINKPGGIDDKLYFCVTKDLITDAIADGLTVKAKDYLLSLLTPSNNFEKSIARSTLASFLIKKDNGGILFFTAGDQTIITTLINDPSKQYCKKAIHQVSLYHFLQEYCRFESTYW